VFTGAMFLFVYVSERGKLPKALIVTSIFLLIPALGVKHQYRQTIAEHTEYGTLEKLGAFGGLMSGVFAGGNKVDLAAADEVAEDRIDHLSTFSYVIATTPAVIPYWNGETYKDFFWSFVPRVLVPSKPKKTLGQDYGHRYLILDKRDHITSINLEQTVEMYANFGLLGVIVGMFVMGLLYRAIYETLGSPIGDGGTLVAACLFRLLLNIESDFSLVFGGVVQQAVLLHIVLYLLARAPKWKRVAGISPVPAP
jgi:hypothetical protein